MRLLIRYLRCAAALYHADPNGPSLFRLLGLYPRWRTGLMHPPLSVEQPWLTYDAIALLTRILKDRPYARVFEYGSGGSTLFFARRAAEVVSVEHDPKWAETVFSRLTATGIENVHYSHIPPDAPIETLPGQAALSNDTISDDITDPAGFLSSDFPGRPLRSYVSRIDAYPDGYFDIVLVDGRARPSCVAHALPKVAPGGWLLLDNAERPEYRPAQALVSAREWRRRALPGPGPLVDYFFLTVAWQKRGKKGETRHCYSQPQSSTAQSQASGRFLKFSGRFFQAAS